MNQDDQMGSAVVTRRIDELLRNPSSSLVDILLDEEAISEFRSGNAKLVSRITELDGMNMLLDLITSHDVSPELSVLQRQQLPFVASEFVACEVDAMLDAFTRIVPSQRTPLDRLFDFLIFGSETNPTIIGYVVRVLLVLVNRRVELMDKYIAAHHEAIVDTLIEKMWDRSVADLLFRLCLDEDIRSFRLDFNKLFSHLSEKSCEYTVWLISSVFGNPLLANNEKVTTTFKYMSFDLVNEGGLSKLAALAFTGTSVSVESAVFDILAILVQYSFTRPVVTERGLSLGDSSSTGWETFASSQPTISSASRMDDDSCVFDDESPSSTLTASRSKDAFTSFGSAVVTECVIRINALPSNTITGEVIRDFSLLRLVAKCVQFQESALLDPQVLARCVAAAFEQYPHSTAVHNACRDCLVLGSSYSFTELKDICNTFCQRLDAIASKSRTSRAHLGRILCRLQESLGNVEFLDQVGHERSSLANTLISEWQSTNARLVDRQDKVPTRVPSPHGVTPIIDLNEQWANIDFATSFPVPEGLFGDENVKMGRVDASLSPQVRFDDPLDTNM